MTMKHIFITLFVLVSFAFTVNAVSGSAEQELLKVEHDRYRAMERIDIAHLDKVMDDNLMFIHASGSIDSKKVFLDRLSTKIQQYNSVVTSDLKARVFGECGVVTGKSDLKITVGERKINPQLIFTSVYAKIGGSWVLVSYQSTLQPEQ